MTQALLPAASQTLLRQEIVPESQPVRLSVTVIICAYTEDRWNDIMAAIDSVRRQILTPREIILVIDHCPELFARAREELVGIIVTENAGTRGLADARNSGIAQASGEIVAFLDDDAAADPTWLEQLSAGYSSDEVLGVGGSVTPEWAKPRPAWFPPEFDWVIGCSYPGLPVSTAPVRNFIGTNMSFRRDALADCGGFQSGLGRTGANAAGCEETELCIRMANRAPSGRLVYEPAARVSHQVPPGRGTWSYFLRRCFGEGRSKAAVARHTGARSATAAERRYVRSVIPRAVGRSLRPRPPVGLGGLAAVLALIVGVGVTTLGYVVELGAHGRRRLGAEVVAAGQRVQTLPAAAKAAPTLWGYVTLSAILALWASVVIGGVSLEKMANFGLLTVLPITFWVCLGALMVSFCVWIRARWVTNRLLAAHVVVLIALLHLTPALLYGTLRYAWAWRHVGIVAFILKHGGVNLHLTQETVYQDWPGFFSLNALLTSGAGYKTALAYATWGPPVFELLYLGPLLLIFRSLTTQRRLQWTAIWIFYLCNWIGQDYFSPQAISYFLYLVFITLCLRWFIGPRRMKTRELVVTAVEDPVFPGRERRVRIAYLLVLPILFALACTHQLTPFILIAALAVLALTRTIRFRSMPMVLAGMTVGWILLASRTFLNQNIGWIVKSIGQPLGNATGSLATASQAIASEVFIANVDRLMTAVVVILAVVSLLRIRKQGYISQLQVPTMLMLVPVAALAATSYGDEIRLRVFLFALPFLSLFAAAAVAPLSGRHSMGSMTGRQHRFGWSAIAALAVFCLLLVGFVFPYYGKEQTNYFSPQEVQVMEHLYALAPPGSLLVGANNNLPWSFSHYSDYQYVWFGSGNAAMTNAVVRSPLNWLTLSMIKYPHAYLIFSKSQLAADQFNGLMPRDALSHIQSAVAHSGLFQRVVHDQDITVYRLART